MTWAPVCRYDDLQPERGVAALIGTQQVALFRAFDEALYAIGNQDPFTGAFVLSRGIMGTKGDVPTVASPLHKQLFDLRTGTCSTTRPRWCRCSASAAGTARSKCGPRGR